MSRLSGRPPLRERRRFDAPLLPTLSGMTVTKKGICPLLKGKDGLRGFLLRRSTSSERAIAPPLVPSRTAHGVPLRYPRPRGDSQLPSPGAWTGYAASCSLQPVDTRTPNQSGGWLPQRVVGHRTVPFHFPATNCTTSLATSETHGRRQVLCLTARELPSSTHLVIDRHALRLRSIT
jgi:hypothetical protein